MHASATCHLLVQDGGQLRAEVETEVWAEEGQWALGRGTLHPLPPKCR